MKPEIPQVLEGIVTQFTAQVLPEVKSPFAAATLTTGIGLLNLIAQEFDRAAARLAEENRAIRAIFASAADVVVDGSLRDRVVAIAAEQPERDLRISSLDRENDRLRALLIELHQQVESLEGPAARACEEAIWEELKESTRRRHVAR